MDQSTAPQTYQAAVPLLREVRKARGLGLRQVAAAVGIDPTHLSRVERGLARLSLDSLLRIAQVLDLQDLERVVAPFAREEPSATPTDRGGA